MGTEIFKFDASWAEKLTKTRVSFLMTPTVLLINTRRSPQDGTEAAWAGLWLLPPTFVATICWHKQHWRWCRPLVTRISYTHTTQQHHNNNTTTSRRNKHSIRQDIFVFRPFFESNNRKNIFVVIFNLFHSSCLVESMKVQRLLLKIWVWSVVGLFYDHFWEGNLCKLKILTCCTTNWILSGLFFGIIICIMYWSNSFLFKASGKPKSFSNFHNFLLQTFIYIKN